MRTIITILHDDSATGIKTIEFSNRLIKGIFIPRSDLKKLYTDTIPEIQHAGVYFLIGENENDELKIYIGQAIHLQKRFDRHTSKKEFWNYAIAFTNKENSLTESDINYLEKQLINRAIQADRAILENKNTGNTCLTPPHRQADMEDFLDDLEILLGTFGFLFLKSFLNKKELNPDQEAFYLTTRGSQAIGYLTQEGFFVKKESTGPLQLVASAINNNYYPARNRPKLLANGIIKEDSNTNQIIFLKDHLFYSPSSAASFISG